MRFTLDMWGESLPDNSNFTMIIASDILLYVKTFPRLINTIKGILKEKGIMWLNNRRRIDSEEVFLKMCRESGFSVAEIYPKVFEIKPN